MNTFKNLTTAVVAAGTLVVVPAMAEVSGNVGVTSNYMFRGATLSADEAAISGGLDYEHESGFYAGTWTSNLAADYELDLYAGFGGEAGGVGYDVGYIEYLYPKNTGGDSFNYGEIYASATVSLFTAGFAYTARSDVDEDATGSSFVEGDLYYYVSVAGDVAEDWSVGFTAGVYTFENDGDAGFSEMDYSHFQLDATKSAGDMGDFTFSLSVADGGQNLFGGTSDTNEELIPFVSWSKGF